MPFTTSVMFADQCPNDSLKIISWNVQDLGSSKNAAEIEIIANLIKDADLVSVQEVVAGSGGQSAVSRLLTELNNQGSNWMSKVSNKTSGEGTERYAFLWKKDRVTLKRTWLSQNLDQPVDREPFIGEFKYKRKKFTVISFHAVPTKKKPEEEIEQLPNIAVLATQKRSVILGDFNLSYQDDAFNPLYLIGFRSHIRGKTSLKKKRKDGKHLYREYDNVFTRGFDVCDAEIVDFSIGYDTLKEARYISDHLPVFVRIY
jgi:deoxyribonuclease-1-like protein